MYSEYCSECEVYIYMIRLPTMAELCVSVCVRWTGQGPSGQKGIQARVDPGGFMLSRCGFVIVVPVTRADSGRSIEQLANV